MSYLMLVVVVLLLLLLLVLLVRRMGPVMLACRPVAFGDFRNIVSVAVEGYRCYVLRGCGPVSAVYGSFYAMHLLSGRLM
jgi:hypothetical protein